MGDVEVPDDWRVPFTVRDEEISILMTLPGGTVRVVPEFTVR